ncbi:MAG: hypothetical protein ACT4PP_07645 [Sporichthyaceae bacterium]
MTPTNGSAGSAAQRVMAGGIAAVATRAAYAVLAARPPAGRKRWERKNYRGESVSLLAGPAVMLGSAAAFALAPGLSGPARLAAVTATLGCGGLGLLDDLAEGRREGPPVKGLSGHLGALRRGRVTTGAVKFAGLPVIGLLAAAPVSTGRRQTLIGAGVIAGYANLINLFDLRPGRASKVALLHSPLALGQGGPALAGALGSATGLLGRELNEQVMLGDAGANALGAALGLAMLLRQQGAGRARTLAALTILIAASEKVSFTRVIAASAGLRWVDELGRRPATALP